VGSVAVTNLGRTTGRRPLGGLAASAGPLSYLPGVYAERILSGMSVPLTLLGLLEREPSHGYELKRDFDAFFGRGRPLSYGQLYRTLSRLARDGKAIAGPAEHGEGPDRRRYVITEQGAADVGRWLAEPTPAEPRLQAVLFAKVVLALMLDRPAARYLDVQRDAHLQRMHELTKLKRDGNVVSTLLADYGLYHLEADLRWMDHTAARLDTLAQAVHP
jgi:DNA-binding PadR family transcriptional regulator